jgi:hypothetical protein
LPVCCHSFNNKATGQYGRVAHIFCENAGRLYTDTEHPVNEDEGRLAAVLVVCARGSRATPGVLDQYQRWPARITRSSGADTGSGRVCGPAMLIVVRIVSTTAYRLQGRGPATPGSPPPR